jgi:hypothetical protein
MVIFKLYGLRKTNQNNKIEDINLVTLFSNHNFTLLKINKMEKQKKGDKIPSLNLPETSNHVWGGSMITSAQCFNFHFSFWKHYHDYIWL